MIESAADFFRCIVLAAIAELEMERIVNDGPPSRFCVINPENRAVSAMYVPTGDSVRVSRSCRLIIEPVDSVKLRALERVSNEWRTQ